MAEWLYLIVGTFLVVVLVGLINNWIQHRRQTMLHALHPSDEATMEQRHERKMVEIVETPANDPREEQGEYYNE